MVKNDYSSKFSIVPIVEENIHFINYFLINAGNALKSFRYFSKRPISVINNHIITAVVLFNQKPIGYGHIDLDDDRIWLGIAISEKHHGKGLGSMMMEYLISKAKDNLINKIFLSVDKENINAIFLYNKFGFKNVVESNDSHYIMCLELVYD